MVVKKQVLFWLAIIVVFAFAILQLRDILLPFVAGIVLAYALNPIVGGLTRIGLPRPLASIVVVAFLVLVVVAIVVLLGPILVNQGQQLVTAIPDEFERMKNLFEAWAKERLGERFASVQRSFESGLGELATSWSGAVANLVPTLWSSGMAIVNFIALLLVTPLVIFYLLLDWPAIIKQADNWMPRDHAPAIRRVATDIDGAIAAFIRGQGLVCLILAVVYGAGLAWAGLKYGLLIGLLTGLLSFVPFVGWATGLLVAGTFAILEGWPSIVLLLKVLAVFAVAVSLDAGFLAPRIVGPKIGLHPVWLIFALFVFSYLFGLVGTLVAVPLAAAIAVLVRFALEVYRTSEIYQGKTAPQSTPAPTVETSE